MEKVGIVDIPSHHKEKNANHKEKNANHQKALNKPPLSCKELAKLVQTILRATKAIIQFHPTCLGHELGTKGLKKGWDNLVVSWDTTHILEERNVKDGLGVDRHNIPIPQPSFRPLCRNYKSPFLTISVILVTILGPLIPAKTSPTLTSSAGTGESWFSRYRR
jgi:hypothetical protein